MQSFLLRIRIRNGSGWIHMDPSGSVWIRALRGQSMDCPARAIHGLRNHTCYCQVQYCSMGRCLILLCNILVDQNSSSLRASSDRLRSPHHATLDSRTAYKLRVINRLIGPTASPNEMILPTTLASCLADTRVTHAVFPKQIEQFCYFIVRNLDLTEFHIDDKS